MSRGVYSLLIELVEDRSIRFRSRSLHHLKKGYYIYTGSAFGDGSASLEKRVERHLKSRKELFWHIDYLLAADSKVLSVIYSTANIRMECEVNKKVSSLSGAQPIRGFGSSDCRSGCVGHLLYLKETGGREALDVLHKAYSSLGLKPTCLGMRFEHR